MINHHLCPKKWIVNTFIIEKIFLRKYIYLEFLQSISCSLHLVFSQFFNESPVLFVSSSSIFSSNQWDLPNISENLNKVYPTPASEISIFTKFSHIFFNYQNEKCLHSLKYYILFKVFHYSSWHPMKRKMSLKVFSLTSSAWYL